MPSTTDHHHVEEEMSTFSFQAAEGSVETFCSNRLIRGESTPPVTNLRMPAGDHDGTTELHLAASRGNINRTNSLLRDQPGMAAMGDAFGRTPLHLASTEGHKEVVKALLMNNASGGCPACLARDKDGRTPLHWAVIRGKADVIEELVRACPDSLNALWEGDTVLHLSVKYNRLKVLEVLLPLIGNNHDYEALLTEGDRDGNTILHLAVLLARVQTVKALLKNQKIVSTARETLNKKGLNAREALVDVPANFRTLEIKRHLASAGIKRLEPTGADPNWIERGKRVFADFAGDQIKWINEARAQLIVVSTLITTITFQVAVNPPGGVFQINFTDIYGQNSALLNKTLECQESYLWNYNKTCQLPGNAVFGYTNPYEFSVFTVFNTMACLASFCVTLILASGFPLRNPIVFTLFTLTVAATLESLIVTLLLSVDMTNPMLRRTAIGFFTLFLSCFTISVYDLFVLLLLILLVGWLFFLGDKYWKLVLSAITAIKDLPHKFKNRASAPNSPSPSSSARKRGNPDIP